jgi:hypothetical protein
MPDDPVELDAHRGMAAQKATGLRRILAEAEAHATSLRERQLQIETELLKSPAASWSEAAGKARYVLNLYYASLSAQDTHHRDLVASILKDFARLDSES